MKPRPKLKIELSGSDRILETAGWILIAAMWSMTTMQFSSLPNSIPIHFDASGKADAFGNRSTIFTLPMIATIVLIGLTILNRYPHVFNYATNINEKNAKKQYTIATRTIRYLKFTAALIFGLICFQTIRLAKGEADGLGT